jgi:hypothetical protein
LLCQNSLSTICFFKMCSYDDVILQIFGGKPEVNCKQNPYQPVF